MTKKNVIEVTNPMVINNIDDRIVFVNKYQGTKIKEYPKTLEYPYKMFSLKNTEDLDEEGNIIDISDTIIQQEKELLLEQLSKTAKKFLEEEADVEFDINTFFELDKIKGWIHKICQEPITQFFIRASDGNITKLCAKIQFYKEGEPFMTWCDEKDNIIVISANQMEVIVKKLQEVQTDVWCNQYKDYQNKINNCKTLEALHKIKIQFTIKYDNLLEL